MSSLFTLAECLALGAAITAALYYFGLALTFFLLPPPFRPWRALVAPFVGIALIVVWDYIALFFQLNLTAATLALLAVGTVVNAALGARILRRNDRRFRGPLPQPPPRKGGEGVRGLWRVRVASPPSLSRPQFPRSPGGSGAGDEGGPEYEGAPTISPKAGRLELSVGLIALLAFLASIAPLVRYGFITVIGENWDYEFYLPLADYLKTSTIEQLQNAPSNPLLPVVTGKFVGRLPMGFSYLHATLDVFFGIAAIDSYAILCALLRALGVVSAFIFFRASLRMNSKAALLASGLYAGSALLLWATFWGFGLQLASLALLPLALSLGVHVLMTRSPRAIPLAALLLAALNVTFHPTLIAALLPLGLIGLYVLITQRDRRRTLAVGSGLLALGAVLSFPTLFRLRDFWREFYALVRLGFGVRDFIPTSDAFGFSLYTLQVIVGQSIPTPWLFEAATRIWDAAALILELAAIALAVLALACIWSDRERRVGWYLITLAYLAYVLILRLPFLHPYPYGFLKALTLVSFVLVALVAEGLFQLPSVVSRVVGGREVRYLQLALGTAFCAISLFTTGTMLEQYFKPAPPFFDGDDLRIREVPRILPHGANVFLTDRVEVQKIPMGLAAYTLRQFPLCGSVMTGYGKMDNATSGAVCDYALLARGEDAGGRGYQSTVLWSNSKFALYPKMPGVIYHSALNGRIAPAQTLTVTLAANRVVTGSDSISSPIATRGVNIALASFVTQTATLTLGDAAQTVVLTPGLSIYRIPQVQLPRRLVIAPQAAPGSGDGSSALPPRALPQADTHLFAPWIELVDGGAGGGGSGVQLNAPTSALLVRCTSPVGSGLDARCFVANPSRHALRWEYIVRGTVKGSHEDQEFVRDGTVASPQQVINIGPGASSTKLTLQFDAAAPDAFPMPKFMDGDYRAALEVFRDDVLLAEIDLYNFAISKDGAVMTKSPLDQPLVIVKAEG